MKYQHDYFDLDKTVSIILAVFFGPLLSLVTRFLDGNVKAGVIRIVLIVFTLGIGSLVLWVLDLLGMIKEQKIYRKF